MEVGDKFGELTVVSARFKRDPTQYPYFVMCTCSCGSGEREYRCVSLTKTKNPTKSCGCLQIKAAVKLKTDVTVGEVFGRLTIVQDLGVLKNKRRVLASCSCGSGIKEFPYKNLKSGHTQSCGCIQKESAALLKQKHGMSGTPEYSSWQSMKERCRNPLSPAYENYGGRGISYDSSWESFEAFYADMGERPDGMSLDRIDVNGNYCKENCRWTTTTIQNFNRRKIEDCTSKYIGVYWDAAREKWVARLNKEGLIVLQKRFVSEEAAARAYDDACFEHYGVRKNFPDT